MKKPRKPRTRKEAKPFDLSSVDPGGRVDVLAANFIDRIADVKIPELKPLLMAKREVIHATLNERLGPHVIDPETAKMFAGFAPLLIMAGRAVIANWNPQVPPVEEKKI